MKKAELPWPVFCYEHSFSCGLIWPPESKQHECLLDLGRFVCMSVVEAEKIIKLKEQLHEARDKLHRCANALVCYSDSANWDERQYYAAGPESAAQEALKGITTEDLLYGEGCSHEWEIRDESYDGPFPNYCSKCGEESK